MILTVQEFGKITTLNIIVMNESTNLLGIFQLDTTKILMENFPVTIYLQNQEKFILLCESFKVLWAHMVDADTGEILATYNINKMIAQ